MNTTQTNTFNQNLRWGLNIDRVENHTLHIRLTGSWQLKDKLPSINDINQQISTIPQIKHVILDTQQMSDWDTGLISFLYKLTKLCKPHNITTDLTGLPEGAQRLLKLACAVPENKDAGRNINKKPLLMRLGASVLEATQNVSAMIHFIGEITLAFGRLLRGQAQYRRSDFILLLQEVGPQALMIVSIISFLVGLILAYMGAVQLSQFGAQIYIADLVGIGMVREIGALMTGIILAGRTGASYAAQLGTMQVNEEIDAFKTLGISPMDFLVMPRVLALIIMAPLLTLYADLVGIFAGMFVAVSSFDVNLFEYIQQTLRALDLRHVLVGLSKGVIYGMLIAFSGCLRGMQCGRSASAVGEATTSAVVTSIVLIVISASILTVIYQEIGI